MPTYSPAQNYERGMGEGGDTRSRTLNFWENCTLNNEFIIAQNTIVKNDTID